MERAGELSPLKGLSIDDGCFDQGFPEWSSRAGEPVARLVSAGQVERSETESVIAEIRRRRAGLTLGGLHWKDLRDEGRR